MRKRNWQMEVETNRALLTRVLAMFFALAGLSPCGSSLPRPLRIFLLRILRPAGSGACQHLSGLTIVPGAFAPCTQDERASLFVANGSIDAMRPAARLQTLLLVLATLLTCVRRIARQQTFRFGAAARSLREGDDACAAPDTAFYPRACARLSARSPPLPA